MVTSYVMVAEAGMAWTPELFYVVTAVVQLITVLVTFRLLNLPAEYNTFINGAFVVGITNALAYYTSGVGVVGILVTCFALFLLLVAISRGDVLKSLIAWILVLSVYWGMAYFVSDHQRALPVQELGGVPYMLMEGGMEAEPLTEEEYQDFRDRGN